MTAPTTVVSLAIFLVLLGPGFTYSRRLDRVRVSADTSPLRELLTVASASILFDLIALASFALIRISAPTVTPDVGEIVRRPGDYLRENYSLVSYWAVGVYVLAIALALASSHPAVLNRTKTSGNKGLGRLLIGKSTIKKSSAWTDLVDLYAGEYSVYVACELDDGSRVSGYLYQLNPKPEETSDRSITLAGPIRAREVGESESKKLIDVQFVVVGADRLVRVELSHIDPDAA